MIYGFKGLGGLGSVGLGGLGCEGSMGFIGFSLDLDKGLQAGALNRALRGY